MIALCAINLSSDGLFGNNGLASYTHSYFNASYVECTSAMFTRVKAAHQYQSAGCNFFSSIDSINGDWLCLSFNSDGIDFSEFSRCTCSTSEFR